MDNKEIENLRKTHNEILEKEDQITDKAERSKSMIVRMKIRSKITLILKQNEKSR